MKNYQKLVRRVTSFYVFANLFHVWLNRRPLALQIFCFQMVVILLWLKFVKKIQPHTDTVVGKGRNALIAFSNNYILFWHCTQTFFKGLLQHGLWNHIIELLYNVTLKFIGISCTLNGCLPMHDFMTSHIGLSEIISSLS